MMGAGLARCREGGALTLERLLLPQELRLLAGKLLFSFELAAVFLVDPPVALLALEDVVGVG